MASRSLHEMAARIRKEALAEWRRWNAAGVPEVAEALAVGMVAATCTPLGVERFDLLYVLERGMQSILPSVREESASVAAALGRTASRSPGLVQELAGHCTDRHEGVARACAGALLAIGGPAAESCTVIDRLQSALEDRRPDVKRAAAAALVGLAPHLGAANEQRLRDRARADVYLRRAIDEFETKQMTTRADGADAGFVRDERVPLNVQVRMLMAALNSKDPQQKRAASRQLRLLMRQGTRVYGRPAEAIVEERRPHLAAVGQQHV